MAAVESAREHYTAKITALSGAGTPNGGDAGGDAGADLATSLMAGLCIGAGAEDSHSVQQGFLLNIDAHEFVPTSSPSPSPSHAHALNANANIFTPSFAELL